jgi:hypothetical protein
MIKAFQRSAAPCFRPSVARGTHTAYRASVCISGRGVPVSRSRPRQRSSHTISGVCAILFSPLRRPSLPSAARRCSAGLGRVGRTSRCPAFPPEAARRWGHERVSSARQMGRWAQSDVPAHHVSCEPCPDSPGAVGLVDACSCLALGLVDPPVTLSRLCIWGLSRLLRRGVV